MKTIPMIIRLMFLALMLSTFSGCTQAELRAINRTLHDENVKMEREYQQRKYRCQQDYANGYREDLNCGY